jgi:hypothetical protein
MFVLICTTNFGNVRVDFSRKFYLLNDWKIMNRKDVEGNGLDVMKLLSRNVSRGTDEHNVKSQSR